jgi:hypothetical protein
MVNIDVSEEPAALLFHPEAGKAGVISQNSVTFT